MSLLTYRLRIKDATAGKHLGKMAHAINYVWNYCQEVSLLAWRRDKTLLSAYDLHTLTAGTSKDLRLSADTIQQVCTEYVTRKRQHKKLKLKWRSRKRSRGWIPFKAASIKLQGDSVTCSTCGQRTGPSGLSALGVREWCCSSCGALHHRDVNAAHNILRTGRGTPIKGILAL